MKTRFDGKLKGFDFDNSPVFISLMKDVNFMINILFGKELVNVGSKFQ